MFRLRVIVLLNVNVDVGSDVNVFQMDFGSSIVFLNIEMTNRVIIVFSNVILSYVVFITIEFYMQYMMYLH